MKFDLLRALDLDIPTGPVGVKAGILENATNSATGESVAMYAACNEFGTKDIPSRPFMRKTFEEHSGEWAELLGRAIANGRPPRQALQLVGMRMADDIVDTIKSDMPPPNAPSTKARKTKKITGTGGGGSYSPGTLVDTGSMVRAVNWEISENEPA